MHSSGGVVAGGAEHYLKIELIGLLISQ